uniref:Uncharacterized protein n=1 Tax=Emiliania huxleyi TaxID=2903 RepID=A0A7S3T9L1_EMIHU
MCGLYDKPADDDEEVVAAVRRFDLPRDATRDMARRVVAYALECMERLRKKKKKGKKCNDWRLCLRAAMLVRESGGSRREAGAAGEDAARAHHAYCEASLQAAVKEAERAEQAAEREAESEAWVAEAGPAPRAPPAAVGEEASIVVSSHSVPLDVWQDHRNTVDELLYFHGIATVSSGELADKELELAELLVDDSPAGELLQRELHELRRVEVWAEVEVEPEGEPVCAKIGLFPAMLACNVLPRVIRCAAGTRSWCTRRTFWCTRRFWRV